MKKIKLFSIAGIVFLLSGFIVFSCKKSSSEDPDFAYIKNFYGVNKVHSFVCLNPTNDTKSLQVDLVWDEKGIATYTTKEIPRDTVSEHNARLFMPSSEFDPQTGTIKPRKSVKTVMLVYQNGTIEAVDNYICNGTWTWTCSNCGLTLGDGHVITQGLNSWVVCGIETNPYCYAHWYCQQNPQPYPVFIGWQSE